MKLSIRKASLSFVFAMMTCIIQTSPAKATSLTFFDYKHFHKDYFLVSQEDVVISKIESNPSQNNKRFLAENVKNTHDSLCRSATRSWTGTGLFGLRHRREIYTLLHEDHSAMAYLMEEEGHQNVVFTLLDKSFYPIASIASSLQAACFFITSLHESSVSRPIGKLSNSPSANQRWSLTLEDSALPEDIASEWPLIGSILIERYNHHRSGPFSYQYRLDLLGEETQDFEEDDFYPDTDSTSADVEHDVTESKTIDQATP